MRALAVAILMVSALVVAVGTAAAVPTGTPCADVSASASPGIVGPGDPETLSGSVANCSGQTETITIGIRATGPCGVGFDRRFPVTLQSDETRALSATFPAPTCEGLYTVKVTAWEGGRLDQAEAMFKVCENCQQG
jgi:hypothetical protein